MVLPDGEKSLTICLPVLTECTNVTARHTHTAVPTSIFLNDDDGLAAPEIDVVY